MIEEFCCKGVMKMQVWVKMDSGGKVTCPFCKVRYTIIMSDEGIDTEEIKCAHWTGEWDAYLSVPPYIEFLFIDNEHIEHIAHSAHT